MIKREERVIVAILDLFFFLDKGRMSLLIGIRTRRAIVEKLGKIIENIKTKFIGDRLFFLPFLRSLQHLSIRQRLAEKTSMGWANGCFAC